MMPASNVGTAAQIAETEPQEWRDQDGTPQGVAIAEQLAHAVRDVRRTCAAVRAAGVRTDDLDAVLDLESAQVNSGGALTRGYIVVEAGHGTREMQAPQTQRFPKNTALHTHVDFDHAADAAGKLAKASPGRSYWVLSFKRETAHNELSR